jgi:hypothetical protein
MGQTFQIQRALGRGILRVRHPWRRRHARPPSVFYHGGWGEFSDGADEDYEWWRDTCKQYNYSKCSLLAWKPTATAVLLLQLLTAASSLLTKWTVRHIVNVASTQATTSPTAAKENVSPVTCGSPLTALQGRNFIADKKRLTLTPTSRSCQAIAEDRT